MSKISINKLAEYMEANPSRRKRIVKDAKEPLTFIVARYKDAKNAIYDYIIKKYDAQIIDDAIEGITEKDPKTELQEQDYTLSVEALEKFIDIELPDLNDYEIEQYTGDNTKLNINDVDISVNPDLIIRGTYRGQKICGAIKIHISKTNTHTDEAGKYVATVLKKYVKDYIAKDDEVVNENFCIAVDTFEQNYTKAPKSFKRRLERIEDACQEINMWWDEV